MWSPYEIDLLLWYHCRVGMHEGHQINAPAYHQAVDRMMLLGLLDIGENDDHAYRPTKKGEALIQLWTNTPVPVEKFVDPRFERSTRADLDVWLTRFKDRGGAGDPSVMSDAQLGRAYNDATEGK